MQADQDNLRRKNEELIQAFRDKSRKHLQTQELYDKLKRRAMLGQVQNAASDAVDHSIQASVTANRHADRLDEQQKYSLQPPLFANQQSGSLRNHGASESVGKMGPPSFKGSNGGNGWAGFSSQEFVQREDFNLSSIVLELKCW